MVLNDIVIIGCGGLAKEMAFLLEEINRSSKKWNILGFVANDDCDSLKYNIVGNDEWLLNCREKINVVLGIGIPQIKFDIYNRFKINTNILFPNIIHPNVTGDWERISFEVGNVFTAGNSFTTDIKIGSFNLVNLNCTIGHNVIIESFNVINPSVNISGGVSLGNRILLGTGAQVLQYLSIGDDCIIGAGSVVTKSISINGTYVGIPAKKV